MLMIDVGMHNDAQKKLFSGRAAADANGWALKHALFSAALIEPLPFHLRIVLHMETDLFIVIKPASTGSFQPVPG